MSSIEVSIQQMFSVFNYLIQTKRMNLTIDSPWVSDDLIEIRFDDETTVIKIRILCEKDSFGDCSSKERLSIDTIKSALIASGIKKTKNWDQGMEKIVTETNRDIYQGDRPCRIVFDTNAFLYRFYSLFERELKRRTKENPRAGWGYLITSGIIGELGGYEKKYKKDQITELQEHRDWFDFERFQNQLVGETRQFRMGSVEASKMRASGRCLRIQSGKGDVSIIDAIEKHKNDQNVDIIAASCDGDFISMCRRREIAGLLFDVAGGVGKEYTSGWEELADLLYTLAIRLGAIRIKWSDEDNFILSGIWRGKKEDSWNREMLSLSTHDKNLISDTKRLLKLIYR